MTRTVKYILQGKDWEGKIVSVIQGHSDKTGYFYAIEENDKRLRRWYRTQKLEDVKNFFYKMVKDKDIVDWWIPEEITDYCI